MLQAETCDQEHRTLSYPILSYPILSIYPIYLSIYLSPILSYPAVPLFSETHMNTDERTQHGCCWGRYISPMQSFEATVCCMYRNMCVMISVSPVLLCNVFLKGLSHFTCVHP